MVDDIGFFKVSKGCKIVGRLLSGSSSANRSRPLTGFAYFDELRAARNALCENFFFKVVVPENGAQDIGIDEDQQPIRKKLRVAKPLPNFVLVTSPSVQGIDDLTFKILPGIGNEALWIELSAFNIDILQKVFATRSSVVHSPSSSSASASPIGWVLPEGS